MTRRAALKVAVGSSTILQIACAMSDPQTCAEVTEIENRYDLAILWVANALAIAKEVRFANSIFQSDSSRVAVSSDGQSIAWASKSAFERPGEPLLSFAETDRAVRKIVLPGYMPLDFAISNRASRILVLARAVGNNRRRLFSFAANPQTEPEDLTDLLSVVSVANINKITISGSGTYGVVSTETQVVVLDVQHRSVTASWQGEEGLISPDGTRVAFLEEGSHLAVREVTTTSSTRPIQSVGVSGISAWSPDGRLLLAGIKTLFSRCIVAVNISRGTFCELAALREGDTGERYVWASQRLVGSSAG